MNGSFLLSDLEEDGRVDAGSRFTGARAGDFEERMELAELRLQDASLCVSVAEATPHAPNGAMHCAIESCYPLRALPPCAAAHSTSFPCTRAVYLLKRIIPLSDILHSSREKTR